MNIHENSDHIRNKFNALDSSETGSSLKKFKTTSASAATMNLGFESATMSSQIDQQASINLTAQENAKELRSRKQSPNVVQTPPSKPKIGFRASSLPFVPTFYPTTKDFKSPYAYFRSLRAVGEQYGVVKVVPPVNFDFHSEFLPEFRKARFRTKRQPIDQLLHRDKSDPSKESTNVQTSAANTSSHNNGNSFIYKTETNSLNTNVSNMIGYSILSVKPDVDTTTLMSLLTSLKIPMNGTEYTQFSSTVINYLKQFPSLDHPDRVKVKKLDVFKSAHDFIVTLLAFQAKASNIHLPIRFPSSPPAVVDLYILWELMLSFGRLENLLEKGCSKLQFALGIRFVNTAENAMHLRFIWTTYCEPLFLAIYNRSDPSSSPSRILPASLSEDCKTQEPVFSNPSHEHRMTDSSHGEDDVVEISPATYHMRTKRQRIQKHGEHVYVERDSHNDDEVSTSTAASENRRRSSRLRQTTPSTHKNDIDFLVDMNIEEDEMPMTRTIQSQCSVCQCCSRPSEIRQCVGCKTAFHTYCSIPPTRIESKPTLCAECRSDEDIFGFSNGAEYSVETFREYSRKLFATLFPNYPIGDTEDIPTTLKLSEMTETYWDIVQHRTIPGSALHKRLSIDYGNDLDTSTVGSGFDSNSEHPWNLNTLARHRPSALSLLPNASIDGVIVPWLYIGALYSSFCWHAEDLFSYSINYLHEGAPKQWFAIGSEYAGIFERIVREKYPDLFNTSPDLLFHITTMFPIDDLAQHGLKTYQAQQHQGEFIVTFPHGYHAGFNGGFNIAESVNFAPCDWFPYGLKCMQRYRMFRRTPVFSVEQCIVLYAQRLAASPSEKIEDSKSTDVDGAEEWEHAAWVSPCLQRIVLHERVLRSYLYIQGITRFIPISCSSSYSVLSDHNFPASTLIGATVLAKWYDDQWYDAIILSTDESGTSFSVKFIDDGLIRDCSENHIQFIHQTEADQNDWKYWQTDSVEQVYSKAKNDNGENGKSSGAPAMKSGGRMAPTIASVASLHCSVCHHDLYMSYIRCSCCPERAVCLSHWAELCQCEPRSKSAIFRYSLAELDALNFKVADVCGIQVEEQPDFVDINDVDDLVKRMQSRPVVHPESRLIMTIINHVNDILAREDAYIDSMDAYDESLRAANKILTWDRKVGDDKVIYRGSSKERIQSISVQWLKSMKEWYARNRNIRNQLLSVEDVEAILRLAEHSIWAGKVTSDVTQLYQQYNTELQNHRIQSRALCSFLGARNFLMHCTSRIQNLLALPIWSDLDGAAFRQAAEILFRKQPLEGTLKIEEATRLVRELEAGYMKPNCICSALKIHYERIYKSSLESIDTPKRGRPRKDASLSSALWIIEQNHVQALKDAINAAKTTVHKYDPNSKELEIFDVSIRIAECPLILDQREGVLEKALVSMNSLIKQRVKEGYMGYKVQRHISSPQAPTPPKSSRNYEKSLPPKSGVRNNETRDNPNASSSNISMKAFTQPNYDPSKYADISTAFQSLLSTVSTTLNENTAINGLSHSSFSLLSSNSALSNVFTATTSERSTPSLHSCTIQNEIVTPPAFYPIVEFILNVTIPHELVSNEQQFWLIAATKLFMTQKPIPFQLLMRIKAKGDEFKLPEPTEENLTKFNRLLNSYRNKEENPRTIEFRGHNKPPQFAIKHANNSGTWICFANQIMTRLQQLMIAATVWIDHYKLLFEPPKEDGPITSSSVPKCNMRNCAILRLRDCEHIVDGSRSEPHECSLGGPLIAIESARLLATSPILQYVSFSELPILSLSIDMVSSWEARVCEVIDIAYNTVGTPAQASTNGQSSSNGSPQTSELTEVKHPKYYHIPYMLGLHAEGTVLPFYSSLLSCLNQFINLVVVVEKNALSHIEDIVTAHDRYTASRIAPYLFPEISQFGPALEFEEVIRKIKTILIQYSQKWKLHWRPSAFVQSLSPTT